MKYDVLNSKTLALFFSCGISLKTWHDLGMIDREVAVYNELSKYFKSIYFFTYGGEDDLEYKSYLAPNITIVPKRFAAGNLLYSVLLPVVQRKILRNVDILKTNQMWGAWSAALAKVLYRKKLIARTGYMWSVNFGREYPKSRKIRFIRGIERFVYKLADAAVTTSQSNLDYVAQNYHPRRQLLITNYVETDVFRPLGQAKQRGSICFVGSLYHVKNPVLLLEALKGLPYSIDLIGSGSQTGQLQEMARNNGIMANFLGNIPNHELPEILDRHELFVLPSLWEGMPKTLLEAMACGLPVIGTNVPGIREVIKDGENGILCDADANSLRQAIVRLMEDGGLRKRLGENARKTIEQDYSLDRLLEGELALYAELLA